MVIAAGGTADMFCDVADDLAQAYRVIAYDRCGNSRPVSAARPTPGRLRSERGTA